jgi:hypothetical protein
MLMYSKLHALLTGSSGKLALKCTVKELYGRHDRLRYVYFQTENKIPCLLYIDSSYDVKMENTKFLNLERWRNDDVNFEAVIASDPDMTIVKEVKSTSSPHGYIDFLKRLDPSLKSINYSVGIISREFLAVLDESEVDVFQITGPKETKLAVVLDLKTLISQNVIPELERVHRNVFKIVQESTDNYWDSLLSLLKKCQQVRIVTNGRNNSENDVLIEQNIKIGMSHRAIKLALECFPNIEP